MLKTETTTHKFYNKWLYKATLRISGVAVFRSFSIASIIDGEFNSQYSISPHSTITKAKANAEILGQLAIFLSSYDKTTYAKRIENNSMDLYTNDRVFFDEVVSKFKDVIHHAFKPDPKSVGLLERSDAIMVKKLPHDKYRYKVFLLPHKISFKEDKIDYLDWIDTQSSRIRISSAVKSWFINTDWNWDRRYILVEDDQTLLMLKLRNAEVFGRVHEYLVVDK